MPTTTTHVDADLFVTVETDSGPVPVFHTYKDDDYDNGPLSYWFSMSFESDGAESGDPNIFDVRALVFEGMPEKPKQPATMTDDNLPTIEKSNKYQTYQGVDYDSPEYAALQIQWDEWHKAEKSRIKDTIIAAVKAGVIKFTDY